MLGNLGNRYLTILGVFPGFYDPFGYRSNGVVGVQKQHFRPLFNSISFCVPSERIFSILKLEMAILYQICITSIY